MGTETGAWLDRIQPRLRLPFRGHDRFTYVRSSPAGVHWVEPERFILDHELVLFRKGAFTVSIGGREHACPENSFIIVPPGIAHASWNSGGTPGIRHWVHFDWAPGGPEPDAQVMTFAPGRLPAHWLRPAPDFVPQGVLRGRIPDSGRAFALHRDLTLWLDPRDGRTFQTGAGLLLSLLLELLAPEGRPRRPSGPGDLLAERVRAALDAAVEKGPPIPDTGDLLESLSVSHEHAGRAFRARYGTSPHAYLQSLRLTRAKTLLRSGDLRVGDVAEILGFGDLPWFSQWFRKRTGVSPGVYGRGASDPSGKASRHG